MTKREPDISDQLAEFEDNLFLTILEYQHIVWTPFSIAAEIFKNPATVTQAKRRIKGINYALMQLVGKRKIKCVKRDGEWVYIVPVERGF
jgi:hypothetical protein